MVNSKVEDKKYRYVLDDPLDVAFSIMSISLGMAYLIHISFNHFNSNIGWIDLAIIALFYGYFIYAFNRGFRRC